MAKMYKRPEGGAFYDAFGGKIGEVEEIWAGDSFNRSTVDCCDATASIFKGFSAEPASLSFTTKNCDYNADALASLAGVSGENMASFKVVANIDTVTDGFEELQRQIDELRDKVKVKVDNKLRVELRTLRYEREVE